MLVRVQNLITYECLKRIRLPARLVKFKPRSLCSAGPTTQFAGPSAKRNLRPLVQKLLRVSRWQQRNIKSAKPCVMSQVRHPCGPLFFLLDPKKVLSKPVSQKCPSYVQMKMHHQMPQIIFPLTDSKIDTILVFPLSFSLFSPRVWIKTSQNISVSCCGAKPGIVWLWTTGSSVYCKRRC